MDVSRECMQQRVHILKEIEIRNVAKWDSAKAKDFISNKVATEVEKSAMGVAS
jgi:hypothetical protein